jgi:hypothetical protein
MSRTPHAALIGAAVAAMALAAVVIASVPTRRVQLLSKPQVKQARVQALADGPNAVSIPPGPRQKGGVVFQRALAPK